MLIYYSIHKKTQYSSFHSMNPMWEAYVGFFSRTKESCAMQATLLGFTNVAQEQLDPSSDLSEIQTLTHQTTTATKHNVLLIYKCQFDFF